MPSLSKTTNRWLILIAGCIFTFSLSGTSAFSVFVSPLMKVTDWEMGQITLAFTLYSVFICIMGIVVGTVAHKIAPAKIVYTGLALYAAGWILSGFAQNVLMLLLTFGLIAGLGGGMLYNYTITSVLKWFPDRRGLASGLVIGFAALGPVFAAPTATGVISTGHVFAGFIVLGVIYGVLTLAAGLLIRPPAEGYVPAGWKPQVAAAGAQLDWRGMLKTASFWLLFIVFIGAGTSYMMMLGAAATIGQEQAGMSVQMATLSVTLVALFNFAGRMGFGAISDKLGREKTLLLAMVLNVIAMLSMSVVSNSMAFLALMCLVGAVGGALLAIFPALVADTFGAKNSTLNYAIMFTAYAVAALVAPQLAAYYREQGNYAPAFLWAGVLTVTGIVCLGIVMKLKANTRRALAARTA